MSQEPVRVMCPACDASGEADSESSRWQCTGCGNGFFLRRCSACARASYVDGLQGFHMPWPCTWCGQFNAGFSQNRDPAEATAAELAAEVARYGLSDGPPESGASGPPESGASGQAESVRLTDGDPGPGTHAPGDRAPGRRRARRIALSIAAVVACAAAITVLGTAGGTGVTAGPAGQGSAMRAVHVTVRQVGTIDFQGAPGQLTIVGTGSGPVILTGQLHGTGSAPTVETRLNQADGVLALFVRCALAEPCTQDLRLAVPGATGAAVSQPGGRMVVTGLAGPLRITAASVDVTASGLRSPGLAATITNGHLSAAFAAAPRQVSVTLASAQATVRLPARTAYRVSQDVTSGRVRVAVPQAGTATRTVTATIHSGALSVLPC